MPRHSTNRHWAKPLSLLFAAVFTLSSSLALSEVIGPNDAKAWLKAAQLAMSQRNYHGMVAYLKNNQFESFKVFHRYADGIEQERLLSVNTPMREVVRNADTVTCYFPEAKSMSVEVRPTRRSSLLELPNDLNELGRYYGFMAGGTEHIAQRLARSVSILPLDHYRYGRRLWIDVDSKLLLKYEVLDENEQVVEQMVFTSLSVEDSIPAADLEASTRADASWRIKRHETLPAESLAWTLDKVPEGFRIIAYSRLLKRGDDDHRIDHMLLSDGLSSVSVYIDHLLKEIVAAHPRKVGAINSYARKIDGYLVTVMGEVPVQTVQVIGDGIRKPGQGSK